MKRGLKIALIAVFIVMILVIIGFLLTKISKNRGSSYEESFTPPENTIWESEKLIIGLDKKNVKVKQGTENFGIPIAFAPDNSDVWGILGEGCFYSITAIEEADDCTNKNWDNPEKDILTGTKNVTFNEVTDNIGYAIIKINIPKKTEPCLQKFIISADCEEYPLETGRSYFYIEVIKRGLL